MRPDPILVQETKGWLKKAAIDIRSAEHALTAIPPISTDAVYHSQQAVEKALKAFLVWNNILFRKTHSIEEIGEQCLDIDPTLKNLVDLGVPLTQYAWEFRYPGDSEEPSQEESVEAVQVAKAIYKDILKRLPTDTHPDSPELKT
jgi:HEPN domain-containing protein